MLHIAQPGMLHRRMPLLLAGLLSVSAFTVARPNMSSAAPTASTLQCSGATDDTGAVEVGGIGALSSSSALNFVGGYSWPLETTLDLDLGAPLMGTTSTSGTIDLPSAPPIVATTWQNILGSDSAPAEGTFWLTTSGPATATGLSANFSTPGSFAYDPDPIALSGSVTPTGSASFQLIPNLRVTYDAGDATVLYAGLNVTVHTITFVCSGPPIAYTAVLPGFPVAAPDSATVPDISTTDPISTEAIAVDPPVVVDVLANDSGPADDPIDPTTLEIIKTPSGVTAELVNSTVEITAITPALAGSSCTSDFGSAEIGSTPEGYPIIELTYERTCNPDLVYQVCNETGCSQSNLTVNYKLTSKNEFIQYPKECYNNPKYINIGTDLKPNYVIDPDGPKPPYGNICSGDTTDYIPPGIPATGSGGPTTTSLYRSNRSTQAPPSTVFPYTSSSRSSSTSIPSTTASTTSTTLLTARTPIQMAATAAPITNKPSFTG